MTTANPIHPTIRISPSISSSRPKSKGIVNVGCFLRQPPGCEDLSTRHKQRYLPGDPFKRALNQDFLPERHQAQRIVRSSWNLDEFLKTEYKRQAPDHHGLGPSQSDRPLRLTDDTATQTCGQTKNLALLRSDRKETKTPCLAFEKSPGRAN